MLRRTAYLRMPIIVNCASQDEIPYQKALYALLRYILYENRREKITDFNQLTWRRPFNDITES